MKSTLFIIGLLCTLAGLIALFVFALKIIAYILLAIGFVIGLIYLVYKNKTND
ncbi:hypothetical protein [Galbibacter orientalis]|uniref:Uncharacterized protein n=1 Tax=Galbibacter orientalis DSM 19592 TaxID=926559 RepID=I3C4G3_9FLAO|nr:hypothetical protein [Galbibacter orientalis]EIJ38506.1 hypothetical protein JoomaDRAFT_1491 [Galbibacter orientalis DSM 19592]|tara:strand:- start:807 stop:965 length:159 start_codon:yes stop_codon:yes gene_type:complete